MITIIEERDKCRVKAPKCPACGAPMIEFHADVPRFRSDPDFADQPREEITHIRGYYFVCRSHRKEQYHLSKEELKILNKYPHYKMVVPEI